MRPAKSDGPKVTIAAGLVLAEFDIDTGSCMRTCYPRQITTVNVPSAESSSGVTTRSVNLDLKLYEQYFANHMLPDGAEKLTVGRTAFVVNRPRLPNYIRLPVYRFVSPGPNSDDTGTTPSQSWTRDLPSDSHDMLAAEVLLVDSDSGDVTFRQGGAALAAPCRVPLEDYIALSALPAELVAFEQKLTQRASPAEVTAGASTTQTNGATFVFVVVNRDLGAGAPRRGFLMALPHYRQLMEALTQALAPRSQPTPEPNPEATSDETGADDAYTEVAAQAVSHGEDVVEAVNVDGQASDGSGSESEDKTDDGLRAEVIDIESDHEVDRPPHTVNPFGEEYSSPLHSAEAQAAGASTASHDSPSGGEGDAASTASGTVQIMLPEGGGSTTSGYTAQNELPEAGSSSAMNGPHSEVNRPTNVATGSSGVPTSVVSGDGCSLYGLCAVVSKRDSAVRRGGITKSVALLGPSLAWLDAFFPILVEAARYCCDIRGSDADAVQQQTQVLKMCYDTISKASPLVTAGLTKTTQLATEVSKFCTYNSDNRQLYAEVRETPFDTQHKLKIPLSPASHDIRCNRYSIEGLAEALGPGFMHLVLGILTEKKIVVLSRQGLSTDVCEAALSLGLVGNLLDPQFVAKKVFPYTSINGVDSFLHVPGYVLGTLNPIFENERHFHWDILCDLDARTVAFSGAEKKRGTTAALAANWNMATAEFANAVGVGEDPSYKGVPPHAARVFKVLLSSIYHMRAMRLSPQERNRRLRLILEEYIQLVAAMVFLVDSDTNLPGPLQSLSNDPSLAKLAAQMRMTSFADAPLKGLLYPGEPPEMVLVAASIRRCRETSAVGVQRLLENVLALVSTSDERVLMFIRHAPVALGGLDPIGYQLLHPSSAVQNAAYAVFKRIEAVPLGKAAISAMSNFLVMVYENMVLREKQRSFYTAAASS